MLDHDFTSYSEGFIVPHGIYDIQKMKDILLSVQVKIQVNLLVSV